ncbi:13337_t:CDS:1, partial [Funneliformis caledonium]
MGFWKNGCFNNYISSELECDDPDKDYMLLENDDYSITTDNTSEIPSTPVTTINDDNCIHEFLFDYEALQNTKEKISLDEYNDDDIMWEDMDLVEKDSVSTTAGSNTDKDYRIDDTDIENKNLIPCVLVD